MTQRAMGGWRIFFWLAAAYNGVIGGAAFLAAEWGSAEAVNGVLIVGFGIIYALVARQPRRFAPVLVAGIFGKAMVVAMLGLPNWGAGGEPSLGAIVAGDLVFTLGFIVFLIALRRRG